MCEIYIKKEILPFDEFVIESKKNGNLIPGLQ